MNVGDDRNAENTPFAICHARSMTVAPNTEQFAAGRNRRSHGGRIAGRLAHMVGWRRLRAMRAGSGGGTKFVTIGAAGVAAGMVAAGLCRNSAAGAVAEARRRMEPLETQFIAPAVSTAAAGVARSATLPAFGKTPLHDAIVAHRWNGMESLEAAGRSLARRAAARSEDPPARVAGVVDILLVAVGLTSGATGVITSAVEGVGPEDLERIVVAAASESAGALRRIPEPLRAAMSAWSPKMLSGFGPQAAVSDANHPHLVNDRAWIGHARDIEWRAMTGGLARLLGLASSGAVAQLRRAWGGRSPLENPVPGVRGPVLFHQTTPRGRIIVGGLGDNVYDGVEDAALIIDLGGNDRYRGAMAVSGPELPVAAVIDLDGDDAYEAADTGLAMGRLGVGLLIDLSGRDVYRLGAGGVGVGVGGIGVLCDANGNDEYTGTVYSAAVALGGVGCCSTCRATTATQPRHGVLDWEDRPAGRR